MKKVHWQLSKLPSEVPFEQQSKRPEYLGMSAGDAAIIGWQSLAYEHAGLILLQNIGFPRR